MERAEVGWRRDRYGEPLDPDVAEEVEHQCRSGWLGEDHHGRPRPCLRCRPHLARAPARCGARPPAGWRAA